jgi:hypothetical protein
VSVYKHKHTTNELRKLERYYLSDSVLLGDVTWGRPWELLGQLVLPTAALVHFWRGVDWVWASPEVSMGAATPVCLLLLSALPL